MNQHISTRPEPERANDMDDSKLMDAIEYAASHLLSKLSQYRGRFEVQQGPQAGSSSSLAEKPDVSELGVIQRHLDEIVSRSIKSPRLRGKFMRPPAFHEMVENLLYRNIHDLPGIVYVWNYSHARLMGRRSLRLFFFQQSPAQQANIFVTAGCLLGIPVPILMGSRALEMQDNPILCQYISNEASGKSYGVPPGRVFVPGSSSSSNNNNNKPSPVLTNASCDAPFLPATRYQPPTASRNLKPAPPAPPPSPVSQGAAPLPHRKRPASTFVASSERMQLESSRWKVIHHALLCPRHEGECLEYPNGECAKMKRVLVHATKCENSHCMVEDCIGTRSMLKHVSQCRSKKCKICVPVKVAALASPQQQERRSSSHSSTPARAETPKQEQEQQGDAARPASPARAGSPPLKKRRVTLEH